MTAKREPAGNKRDVVAKLSEKFSKAEGVILTDYRGLTVADLTNLRIKLRLIQGELRILQNRLSRIAMKEMTGAEPLTRHLKGPTAAAITYGDPVLLAKTIKEFAEEKETFKIKAGLVSGRFLESADVSRLASLPSKPVLIAGFVGMVASPLRRLVTVLSQPQRGLVQVLAQVAKKKG